MSAATAVLSKTEIERRPSHTATIYLKEAKYEFLKNFTGPNSAPAAINLIYLPMSFCSGLWVPYMFLPKLVRQIALALPPYHLSQLALGTVGAGFHQSTATHWEVLLAFTLICLGVARIGFQRDQGKLYG
jgi:ABC-2 type transport system permease protein